MFCQDCQKLKKKFLKNEFCYCTTENHIIFKLCGFVAPLFVSDIEIRQLIIPEKMKGCLSLGNNGVPNIPFLSIFFLLHYQR
jgi:hypothetical protein